MDIWEAVIGGASMITKNSIQKQAEKQNESILRVELGLVQAGLDLDHGGCNNAEAEHMVMRSLSQMQRKHLSGEAPEVALAFLQGLVELIIGERGKDQILPTSDDSVLGRPRVLGLSDDFVRWVIKGDREGPQASPFLGLCGLAAYGEEERKSDKAASFIAVTEWILQISKEVVDAVKNSKHFDMTSALKQCAALLEQDMISRYKRIRQHLQDIEIRMLQSLFRKFPVTKISNQKNGNPKEKLDEILKKSKYSDLAKMGGARLEEIRSILLGFALDSKHASLGDIVIAVLFEDKWDLCQQLRTDYDRSFGSFIALGGFQVL